MKYTKFRQVEDKDGVSILWSNENNAYKFSEGRTLGTVTFDTYAETLDYSQNGLNKETQEQIIAGGDKLDNIRVRHFQFQNHIYAPSDFYDADVVDETIVNDLPYGVFNMGYNTRHETLFKPFKMDKENLRLIKNRTLKSDIVEFFTNKSDTGRKNKMGMLLYGPPGNGKTTEVMSLFEVCDELKLRIFIIDSEFSIGSIQNAKQVLHGENVVFVLEEITERLSKRGVEEILTFLDGENSWTNSVTIATTNYPEHMPSNLVDRPGRFEKFIQYSNPTREEIIALGVAFGIEENAVSCLVGQELSFDYVSFILSKSVKLGLSVKETRDSEESKRKRLSATFKGKIGF